MISLMWNLIKWYKWSYLRKQTHRLWKQTFSYQQGKVGGRDKLGVLDEHIHTLTYKTESQQRPTVLHRELCLMLCNPMGFFGRNDAEAETPVLWPPDAKSWLFGKDWCWEGLGAGEGDDRGWDGWMASLTWWMWVWVNSGSWWWTGRPGVLRFMGSQRVGQDWATDLTELTEK